MSFSNSQLAQKLSDLIDYWSNFSVEHKNWLGGVVGGGPNLDGEYPLTDYAGNEILVKSPAQLQDDVDNITTGATAQANAAAASAAAASNSETNAAASAATATAQAALADADRVAAELAETNATNAAVTSTTQANLATDRAGYAQEWAITVEDTLVSVAAGGNGTTDYSALHHAAKSADSAAASAASAAAALVSENNAAASAAAAATFDPALFMKLDGTQAMTGTLQGVAATFSGAVTGSNLNVANWDTAYGWGDHSTQNYAVTTGDTFTGQVNFNEAIILGNAISRLYFNDSADAGTRAFFAPRNAGDTDWAWASEFGWNHTNQRWYFDGSLDVAGVTLTSTKFSNWDTAYSWGDHSAQNYADRDTANAFLSTMSIDTAGSHITLRETDGADPADRAILEVNGGQFNIYLHDTTPGTWRLPFRASLTSDAVAMAGDVVLTCPATGRLEIRGSSYQVNPTGIAIGQYSSTLGYIQAPALGSVAIWNDGTGEIARFDDDNTVHIPSGALNLGVYGTTAGGSLKIHGTTINKTSELICTNGNLHIDSAAGSQVYLNYYSNTGGVYIGAAGGFKSVLTGQYGAVQTQGSTGGYGGISLDGNFALMNSGSSHVGLYNDIHNEWFMLCYPNSYVNLYYNGVVALQTQSFSNVRIGSTYGYVDIGPQNTSWCHNVTDRANFYFNKGAHFAGEVVRYTLGAYYYNGSSSYASGKVTFSTGAATGGSSGDIWYQYT